MWSWMWTSFAKFLNVSCSLSNEGHKSERETQFYHVLLSLLSFLPPLVQLCACALSSCVCVSCPAVCVCLVKLCVLSSCVYCQAVCIVKLCVYIFLISLRDFILCTLRYTMSCSSRALPLRNCCTTPPEVQIGTSLFMLHFMLSSSALAWPRSPAPYSDAG